MLASVRFVLYNVQPPIAFCYPSSFVDSHIFLSETGALFRHSQNEKTGGPCSDLNKVSDDNMRSVSGLIVVYFKVFPFPQNFKNFGNTMKLTGLYQVNVMVGFVFSSIFL